MVSHWAGGLGSFYIQLLDPGYFACRSVRHKRTFAAVKCCWFLQMLQTEAKQLPDSTDLHIGRRVWRWIIAQLNWTIYKETKPCFTLSLFKDCCWPVNTEFLNGEKCCTLPLLSAFILKWWNWGEGSELLQMTSDSSQHPHSPSQKQRTRLEMSVSEVRASVALSSKLVVLPCPFKKKTKKKPNKHCVVWLLPKQKSEEQEWEQGGASWRVPRPLVVRTGSPWGVLL